jgi:hypothetical protein
MIRYNITDHATPDLRALLRRIPPSRPFMASLGKRLETLLRDHFRRKDKVPNKRGWRKSHFWGRRIRNATTLTEVTERAATVTIADPAFAAQLHGTVIRPKEARALAIPLIEEAYGIQPSSGLIEGLFIIRPKGEEHAFLARDHATQEGLEYVYLLTKRATIPADPTALPPEQLVNQSLLDQATRWLSTHLRK